MPKTTLARKKEVQIGSIQAHAGQTAPDGFLICDGTIVQIADYPKLYERIGTSWGHGNEVSPGVSDGLSFHLPDLRGRFLRGTDDPTGIDPAGRDSEAGSRTPSNAGGNTGNNVGSVQDDKTRRPRSTGFTGSISGSATGGAHGHNLKVRTRAIDGSGSEGDKTVDLSQPEESGYVTNTNSAHTHSVSGSANINGGGDPETRPINASVNYIIRAI